MLNLPPEEDDYQVRRGAGLHEPVASLLMLLSKPVGSISLSICVPASKQSCFCRDSLQAEGEAGEGGAAGVAGAGMNDRLLSASRYPVASSRNILAGKLQLTLWLLSPSLSMNAEKE